jgi:hypothetical protein
VGRLLRQAWILIVVVLLAATPAAHAYSWPVRPFDVPHPIRGNFGDPRTVFRTGILDDAGLDGEGAFSFHNGVDISADAGTAVYPVASGVAIAVSTEMIVVRATNHRTFQYIHLDPVVVTGERLTAKRTVLGFVKASAGHVHLTEIDRGRVVNPLERGHLTPYFDYTRPEVSSVIFRDAQARPLSPSGVHGSVAIIGVASDLPSLPVPGSWYGLPVAPALVEWSLTAPAGNEVVPLRVAADFRQTLPFNKDFWQVYARGTYQNKPRFGNIQYGDAPGRYEFRLTRPSLDTRRLRDGVYTLSVKAVDMRGNTGTRVETVQICNAGSCAVTRPRKG